jgi:hypothetical protein
MDWLMLAFAVFYLMLAALAVAVWLQLRWENFGPVLRQSSRRPGRKTGAAPASLRNVRRPEDLPTGPPNDRFR